MPTQNAMTTLLSSTARTSRMSLATQSHAPSPGGTGRRALAASNTWRRAALSGSSIPVAEAAPHCQAARTGRPVPVPRSQNVSPATCRSNSRLPSWFGRMLPLMPIPDVLRSALSDTRRTAA